MRLAILDDDMAFSDRAARIMGKAGHQVVQFRDVKSVLRGLSQNSFDLLLVEWTLPDSSGLEVLSWMQQHLDSAPPTIMITARFAQSYIVAGLTSGADDYIVKPVRDDMLKARVDAVLRRAYGRPAKQSVEPYGQHVFDLEHRSVTVAGAPVATTAKEFALALLLFRNLHRPLSRGHIQEAVWGNPDIMSRTLDAHISQIRTRLGLRPENGLRLSSVYSFGYRLERVAEGFTPSAANDRSATVSGVSV